MFGLSIGTITPEPTPTNAELVEALKQELMFDQSWEIYLLTKLGCPSPTTTGPLYPSDCINTPHIDYAAYIKARKLAAKVFKFESCKDE